MCNDSENVRGHIILRQESDGFFCISFEEMRFNLKVLTQQTDIGELTSCGVINYLANRVYLFFFFLPEGCVIMLKSGGGLTLPSPATSAFLSAE